MIMTASCGIEGAKGPIAYKSLVEGAVEKSTHKPFRTIVWQRDEVRWDPIVREDGQRNWQRVVKSARNRGLKADAVPIESHEGVYIIYTSGRRPTRILHHLIALAHIHQERRVYPKAWCVKTPAMSWV